MTTGGVPVLLAAGDTDLRDDGCESLGLEGDLDVCAPVPDIEGNTCDNKDCYVTLTSRNQSLQPQP